MSKIPSGFRRSGDRSVPSATPTITIVLAVFNPPLAALRTQLEAIASQTSTAWECVIVDDASSAPGVVDLLTSWSAIDPPRRRLIERPANGGIAAATNDGIDAALGDIITICDHDDVIHATAIERVVEHFEEHPEHDVVYTDEQVIDEAGRLVASYLKPDYSPRRHLGQHYLNHLVAARRSAIGDLRVRQAYEPCQDFDFHVRVIEAAAQRGHGVGHIAEVLYSWRAIAGSSALDATEKPEMTAAVERCVRAILERRNVDASANTVWLDGAATTAVEVQFSGEVPAVATIGVTSSTSPSEVNEAAAATPGAVIVLSPDTVDFGSTWAAPLALEALRADVGVVGPLITGSDGRVLSVGRVVQPTLADPFAGDVSAAAGPWGAFLVAREVSAVAPWGATVSRADFEAVGGLRVDVGLDVAVTELCVRLAANGQATVWSPTAHLTLEPESPCRPESGALLSSEAGQRGTRLGELRHATRRTPQLAVERYSLGGLGQLNQLTPNAYVEADTLIRSGAIDLVTSDVFDTIVTRPVASPSDVFVALAAELALPPTVSAPIFAHARRNAEHRARQRRIEARRSELLTAGFERAAIDTDPQIVAPECTLAEIWSLMPAEWVSADVGIAAELALEASMLTPIPEAVAVLRTAQQHDIPAVLVSDIYLSSTQLSALLVDVGIDIGLVAGVVTSADHRRGKAQGLLAQVVADRGVDAGRVLHLGDNEVADVATAAELGARPIHVEVPTAKTHVQLPPAPLHHWSRSQGTDLGISAAVRSVLVDAGQLGHDPSFQFGTAVAGPALAGFSRWVSDTTIALGATHTHCMLREGATIAELMQLTAPAGAVPVEIHVSRWVTMRAAVIDANADELVTALARRADLTAASVAHAFSCDADDVRRVLGVDQFDSGHLREACIALSGDDELRAQIVHSSAELRRRVAVYLRQRVQFDERAPLVVADVGWGGTIQEGLTRILTAEGIECEVVGLYLALSAAGEQRVAQGARMLSYLPSEFEAPTVAHRTRSIAHHADSIERIMTPEIGTLLDITADGSPVCRDASDDRLPPTLAAAQRGLRQVAEQLVENTTGHSDFADRRWSSLELRSAFAETIADAVTVPSAPLAEALGAWPHDDVAGTDHRSIAGAGLQDAVRYANARDIGRLDPAGRNWIAGLAAAVNPLVSAQLAAEQSGFPLARFTPLSENGVARIAAFEVGSSLSSLQVGHHVGVAAGGWSVLRLAGPVASLRSLRFDAGEDDALVDLGHFEITMTTVDGWKTPTRHLDLLDDDITWVDAHPLDHRRLSQRPGGHLLVDISPDLASAVRSVEVVAAFRSWRLEPGSALSRTPVLHQLDHQRRRIASAVRRRIR
ncbi:MAG: glycosyltransferase [Ilumatobacter sp.]